MKRLMIIAVLTGLLTACETVKDISGAVTQDIGGQAFPEPSPGFEPKATLPYSTAKVYQAALNTLEDENIIIASESKQNGRITTDYIAGPTQMTALGLLGTISTRYKYQINVKQREKGTKLTVTAYLESSGNQVQSWRDVSADNPQAISVLQKALTEKIEKNLTP